MTQNPARAALSAAINKAIANGAPVITEQPTKACLFARFEAADEAWSRYLDGMFGRDACNVRYLPEGRGDVGSELRRLYLARDVAMRAYQDAGPWPTV